MQIYRRITSTIEKLRLLFQRRVKDGQIAYLGNGAGVVEVPGKIGYVYARFPGGKDANGFARFGTPFMCRSGNAGYPNYEGATVYVAWGYSNEPEIVSAHYQELDQAGIDTRILNPLAQQSKWVYPWQLTYALPSAVANNFTDSLLVTIKKFLHIVGNVFQFYETNDSDEMIDLAAYVPGADLHCYAALWLDSYTNEITVTVSTAQSLFTPLDLTDIQELVTNRPPDATPLKAFYLSNEQTTLKQNAQEVDLRQWLNFPEPFGLPNPIVYQERIRDGYQQLYADALVTTGTLIVDGVLIGIPTTPGSGGGAGSMTDFDITADTGSAITVTDGDTVNVTGEEGIETETSGFDVIVRGRKFNYPASDIPNTGDDDTQGYVAFSLWINQATGRMYYCAFPATGAAVWYELITTEILGQELDGKILNTPIIDFILDPNGDVAVYVQGDGNAANADSVAIGTFTDIPRIYVNTFSTNRNLEIMAAGTGNIVSGSTIRSDTDNTDDLGTTAVKWRNILAFLATFEERSTPTTPATGDYGIYAKASGGGGAAFGIDDAGTELQLSPQIAIILDSQASGSSAGATTTTTWVTRPIQTEVDPYALVTLSSNKFTPVAGVYDVRVFATAIANSAAVTLAVHRLFNVNTTTEIGKSPPVRLVADTGSTASFETKLTANGTDEFRVDTYVTSGRATNGLGQPVSTGSNEVFTIIVLRKIG